MKTEYEEELKKTRFHSEEKERNFKAENDSLTAKNAMLERENERLKTENLVLKAQPSMNQMGSAAWNPPSQPNNWHPPVPMQPQAPRPPVTGALGLAEFITPGRGLLPTPPGPPLYQPTQNFRSNKKNKPNQAQNQAQSTSIAAPNTGVSFGDTKKRKYTPAQEAKRKEKLLTRLIAKSKENGVDFIPEPGGVLESLYKEKVAKGLLPPITGLNNLSNIITYIVPSQIPLSSISCCSKANRICR